MIWKIALLGSDTYYEPDAKSEVSLTTMGFTDPLEDEDTDWLLLDVIGAPGIRENIDGITKQGNGRAVHTKGQSKTIRLHFVDFLFPSEYDKKEALEDLLNHQFIYFYQGGYVFDNFQHHSDGKCLLVACSHSVEDDFDNGVVRVTLDMQLVNPII